MKGYLDLTKGSKPFKRSLVTSLLHTTYEWQAHHPRPRQPASEVETSQTAARTEKYKTRDGL